MTDKKDIRASAAQVRERAAAAGSAYASLRMAARFIGGPLTAWEGLGKPVIAGYWPFGTEMDTKPLLHNLHGKGYSVALPVTLFDDPILTFRRWTPDMDMETDALGMDAPPRSARLLEPDIIIVPGLAFDTRGYRIGYGSGCYDATLSSLRSVRPVIAALVAYSAQELPEVPTEPHDEPVDWIVTETAARRTGP